jgi:carbon-monoxide dehydrogenase large subunit
MSSERKEVVVGRSILRKEDQRILLGQAQYVGDIKLPRMLSAAILRSPYAHAVISAIDTAACRSDPRLVAVITGDDVREIPPLPSLDAEPTAKQFLQPVLAREKVRFVGEPIAVVVAADRYIAEDLLSLIDVTYEPLPAIVTSEQSLSEEGPFIHEQGNVSDVWKFAVGDGTVFERAPHMLREKFSTQRFAGTPLETRGVVAMWDEGRAKLTLHTSTQVPHFVKGIVAAYLNLEAHSVRVIAPDVGGAFGAKIQPFAEDVLVARLAMELKRPVKWIEDRYEHFVGSNHGREQTHDLEVVYDDAGVVLGLRDTIVTNVGAYLQAFTFADAQCAVLTVRGPYRIPAFEAESTVVVSNKTPLNPFRGVGMSQATFAIERAMDMIARERGLDPVEVRLRNLLGPEEFPVDRGVPMTFQGSVLDSGDYAVALKRALELAEYEEFREKQTALRKSGRYIGIGIASYVEKTALGPFESSTVRVDESGIVTVVTGAGPSGQGTETTLAQIAAEELGVSMDRVRVVLGDTDLVPWGGGSYASRMAAVGGTAVRLASRSVREKVLAVAGELLEVRVADLELRDGAASVLGVPTASVSIAQIAQSVAPGRPLPAGIDTYGLEETEVFQPAAEAFSFGTVVATVEVDIETGVVTPMRLVMVGDCGRVINPMLVAGQYHGGLSLGLGGALLEELIYDDQGQLVNATFMDYLMPQADDIPEIIIDHTTTLTDLNPDGLKGAGESGAIPTPGAIANAVSDALTPFKVSIVETPITPARVFQLIRAASV